MLKELSVNTNALQQNTYKNCFYNVNEIALYLQTKWNKSKTLQRIKDKFVVFNITFLQLIYFIT